MCLVHHEYLSQFGPYSFLSSGLAELPESLKRILSILHRCFGVFAIALLLPVLLLVQLGIWRPCR